jgi:hypothetical protein
MRSSVPARTGRWGALDRQQMLLLEALRRAAGAPVSYAQLQELGVEFPASVVSELELAGVTIERRHANAHGTRRLVGVRLDRSCDPYRTLVGPTTRGFNPVSTLATHNQRARIHIYRVSATERLRRRVEAATSTTARRMRVEPGTSTTARRMRVEPGTSTTARRMRVEAATSTTARRMFVALSRAANSVREHTRQVQVDSKGGTALLAGVSLYPIRVVRELGSGAAKRWLAPVALFAAAGLVAALVLVELSGNGRAPHVAVHHHRLRQTAVAVAPSHAPRSETHSSTAAPPQHVGHPKPTPVSATLAAQLDAQGHDLLGVGRYGDAIAVLQSALAATGKRLQDCLQPTSETCLIYAYALYDLGSALRLDGQPAAAVPVLQRRLQIDNQRPTVQAQLELALTRAS